MNKLIDGAINTSRMVIVVLVFALIAGAVTYSNLPRESDPEIDFPVIQVTVPLEGISPNDAERLIIRPAEKELQTIEGLKELNGAALEGAGQLTMEFDISFKADQAFLDVREKIDLAKRDFPSDAQEPVITEINTSLFPILVVNMYGKIPERALTSVVRDLENKLEKLPGVLEARIQGDREEVLEVIVDPKKLEAYNLSYQEILQTVSANNQLIPAGRIDTGSGRFPIKVPGLIKLSLIHI